MHVCENIVMRSTQCSFFFSQFPGGGRAMKLTFNKGFESWCIKKMFTYLCTPTSLRKRQICFTLWITLKLYVSDWWKWTLMKTIPDHLPLNQKAWGPQTRCWHRSQGKWCSWCPCWTISRLRATGVWCLVNQERCWTLFSGLSLIG